MVRKYIFLAGISLFLIANAIQAQSMDTMVIFYPALIPDVTYFVENVTFNESLEDKLWEIRDEMPDHSLLGHERVANQISIRSKGNDKVNYYLTESWCILDVLDLSQITDEKIEFSFWNYTLYANGDQAADWLAKIELMATSDFNASATLTQWDNLTQGLDTLDKALDYDYNWVKSTISLDAYRGQGTLRLAFKFTVPKDGIMAQGVERPGNWWITDVRAVAISERNVPVIDRKYVSMIFPNPACNTVYFKEEPKNLKVYSIEGNEVQVNYNSRSNYLNISELPQGIYIVKMSYEKGEEHTLRLIKEK